jgi:hypothetical protein
VKPAKSERAFVPSKVIVVTEEGQHTAELEASPIGHGLWILSRSNANNGADHSQAQELSSRVDADRDERSLDATQLERLAASGHDDERNPT